MSRKVNGSFPYRCFRFHTCLIESFQGMNRIGVKHPKMAVIAGSNARLAWKCYMISNDISTDTNKNTLFRERN